MATIDPFATCDVMICSTVKDLAKERVAAERAIRGLNLNIFRAEDLGSVAGSPRELCELLAQKCDLFVLLVGESSGFIIESEGISVIEFEYEVAHAQNPGKILIYLKDGVHREPRLEEFLKRVQDFDHGYVTSSFITPEDLYQKIQVDIVRWLTSHAKK